MRTVPNEDDILVAVAFAEVGPATRHDCTHTTSPYRGQKQIRQHHWILHNDAAETDVDRWRPCLKEMCKVIRRRVDWFLSEEESADILDSVSAARELATWE